MSDKEIHELNIQLASYLLNRDRTLRELNVQLNILDSEYDRIYEADATDSRLEEIGKAINDVSEKITVQENGIKQLNQRILNLSNRYMEMFGAARDSLDPSLTPFAIHFKNDYEKLSEFFRLIALKLAMDNLLSMYEIPILYTLLSQYPSDITLGAQLWFISHTQGRLLEGFIHQISPLPSPRGGGVIRVTPPRTAFPPTPHTPAGGWVSYVTPGTRSGNISGTASPIPVAVEMEPGTFAVASSSQLPLRPSVPLSLLQEENPPKRQRRGDTPLLICTELLDEDTGNEDEDEENQTWGPKDPNAFGRRSYRKLRKRRKPKRGRRSRKIRRRKRG